MVSWKGDYFFYFSYLDLYECSSLAERQIVKQIYVNEHQLTLTSCAATWLFPYKRTSLRRDQWIFERFYCIDFAKLMINFV